jgi:hypothetical protein
VRRLIAILAIAWFGALGTGLVEFAHNAQHAMEDALAARMGADRLHPDQTPPHHDDSNCAVHAQLHLPLIATPIVVLLICAGLFVAFVSQLAPVLVLARLPSRIDCRGPPVLV